MVLRTTYNFIRIFQQVRNFPFASVPSYSSHVLEFVSGDRSDIAQWNYGTTDSIAYHQVFKQTQLLFSEKSDQGEWGNWYYVTDAVDGVTYQSGIDNDVRGAFTSNGKLTNSKDTNYRAINSNWPVFGFAIDLGSVGSSAVNTLFSLGLCQNDAIQFDGKNGVVSLPSLWTSYFSDDLAAVGSILWIESIVKI
jgi:Domain of unknown function (DUF5127)